MIKSKIAVLYTLTRNEIENYNIKASSHYALRGWTRVHDALSRTVGEGVDSLLGLNRKHNSDYNIRGRNNNTILYFMNFKQKTPTRNQSDGGREKKREIERKD